MVNAISGGNMRQRAAFTGGTAVLVVIWCFLFLWMAAMTEGWLAPWDCVDISLRPPVGTWHRTVNDFFEGPPGFSLPPVAFVAIGATIFAAGAVRSAKRPLLPWAFAGTYAMFFLVQIILVPLADRLPDLWLPQPRPALDVGYYRTWRAILATAALALALFLVQGLMALGTRRVASSSVWR
jgi:hypothetical protein